MSHVRTPHACFIWRTPHPAIRAAAIARLRWGWTAEASSAEPCVLEGAVVHALADGDARRQPLRWRQALGRPQCTTPASDGTFF